MRLLLVLVQYGCHCISTEQAKKCRILWSVSKRDDGTWASVTPYIIRSSVLMGCRYGSDTHLARRKKNALSASSDKVCVHTALCLKSNNFCLVETKCATKQHYISSWWLANDWLANDYICVHELSSALGRSLSLHHDPMNCQLTSVKSTSSSHSSDILRHFYLKLHIQ